jgi:four helix bundle protein
MATFNRFEEIEAWRRARLHVREVYAITNEGRFSKDFGLRNQIRRASVSVMANIAEGFERNGTGEFIQFLSIAKGSAGEIRAHLYVADQYYIDMQTLKRPMIDAESIGKKIGGLMDYLRSSGFKGTKYRSASGLQPETLNTKPETF